MLGFFFKPSKFNAHLTRSKHESIKIVVHLYCTYFKYAVLNFFLRKFSKILLHT